MDSVVYVDGHRMSRSECTGAHAHLDIRCLNMILGLFYHISHHMIYRIRPNYRTVRSGFSNVHGNFVVNYDSTY